MQWYEIIGWLAAAVLIAGSSCKKDKPLLLLSMASMFLFSVSYTLQGVFSTAATLLLVTIRYALPLKFKGWTPVFIFWAIHIATTTIFYRDYLDFLTLAASIISIVGVFIFTGTRLRLLMVLQSSLWLIYDVSMSFTPGIITEALYVSMTMVTLIRCLQDESSSSLM